MKLPTALYRELAQKYGLDIADLAQRETVSEIRLADGGPGQEDALVLPASAPADFLNEAIRLTESCGRWLTTLDVCLDRGASPQELVDLSEEILGEPVFIVDPSMKRIAVTRHTGASDIFYSEIASQGYPSLDTYDRLNLDNYYDPRYYSGKVMRLSTDGEPPRDVALRGLRIQGKLAATAMMIFQNEPWSEGKVGLFSALSERLAKSLEGPWVQSDSRSEQYDFLLRELLTGKTLQEAEIAARIRYIGWTDPCPCHAVIFAANDSSRAKLGYVCRILDSVFPHTRPLIHENAVLTLLPARDGEKDAALDSLEQFCVRTDCRCAVSARLERLSALAEAYGQAVETLELGRELAEKGVWFSLSRSEGRAFTFCHDDFAVYRAVRLFAQSHSIESLCSSAFWQLQRADRENQTDNLRVLYHYLCGHQNYTEAARRLFMHRNSVFYRIDRICALLGVSRIDTDMERAFLFSYMVDDVRRLSAISPKT